MIEFDIPSINSIRIRPMEGRISGDLAINYATIMATPDRMALGEKYQRGVEPGNYTVDKLVNKPISLQLRFNTTSIFNGEIRCYNSETSTFVNVSLVEITPVGYVGVKVYKVTYTPTIKGYYYLWGKYDQLSPSAEDYTFISDEFYVSDSLSDDKNLLEFQFKDSENNLGYVFDAYYYAYYTGIFEIQSPQTEVNVIEEDIAPEVTSSRSWSRVKITLTDISDKYINTVSQMLRCDSILFNGIEYICNEGLTIEPTQYSDIVDISFILTGKTSIDNLNF
jgi:hypothetical protein